jgi:hypothetical protein
MSGVGESQIADQDRPVKRQAIRRNLDAYAKGSLSFPPERASELFSIQLSTVVQEQSNQADRVTDRS